MRYETSNYFLETVVYLSDGELEFLTNHAQALLCIARDPASRLRDIAASRIPRTTTARPVAE
jgi:hypothetical protein